MSHPKLNTIAAIEIMQGEVDGDFDSLEYGRLILREKDRLESYSIKFIMIAIGDELLNGFTADTNSQWLKAK